MQKDKMNVEFAEVLMKNDFNWLEKVALMASHPRNLFIHSVAIIWAVYFLWLRDGEAAAVIYFAVAIFGFLTVFASNPVALSRTTLGKLALLHLNPFNFVVQSAGILVLGSGIWMHSSERILSGLSLIMIGHAFGWNIVNRRFKAQDLNAVLD